MNAKQNSYSIGIIQCVLHGTLFGYAVCGLVEMPHRHSILASDKNTLLEEHVET